MSIERLTDQRIRQHNPAATEIWWDKHKDAFGIRFGKKRKTWVVSARRPGEKACGTYRIGEFPDLKLADARKKADEMLQGVTEGRDPFPPRGGGNSAVAQPRERGEAAKDEPTFGELAQRFLNEIIPAWNLRPATIRKYRWGLLGSEAEGPKEPGTPGAKPKQSPIAAWQDRPISSIRRDDIRAAHRELTEATQKGVSANRLLAYLNPFFDWLEDEEIITRNPVPPKRWRPKNTEDERGRVLSDSELAEVWQAADGLGTIFGPLFKLIILTGTRKEEAAMLRLDELQDLDGKDPLWVLPASRSKNKREHIIPLSPQAVKAIREALALKADLIKYGGMQDNQWVFPSEAGDKPVKSVASHAIKQLYRAIAKARGEGAEQMQHWTTHDLRRTFVDSLKRPSFGIDERIVEDCVNHSRRSKIERTYSPTVHVDPRREALNKWGEFIDQLTGQNVIPMQSAATI